MNRIRAASVGLLLVYTCAVVDTSGRQATAKPVVTTPMQDLFVMIFGLFAIVPVRGPDDKLVEILVLFAQEDGGETVADILGSRTHAVHGEEVVEKHCPTIVRSAEPIASCAEPLSGDHLVYGSGNETTFSSEGAIDLTEVLGSAELATAKDSCTGEDFDSECGASARIRLRGGSARSFDFGGQPRTSLRADIDDIDFSLERRLRSWVGLRSLRSDSALSLSYPRATMLLFHTTVEEAIPGMHPVIPEVCAHLRERAGMESQQRNCLVQILQNIPLGAQFPTAPVPLGTEDYHFLTIYDLLKWEVYDRPIPFVKARVDGQGNPPGGRCDSPVLAPTFRPPR